jgi:site-specific DNA-cytosine methylase
MKKLLDLCCGVGGATYGEGGGKGSVDEWREAMGIDWTWERKSIAEAIPPAYTEFIGKHLIDRIGK